MDPFGTAALRNRVLAAWAASPARFREDANAEEDLARGSYRDRVVVELAQNAADAAARAGIGGRLLLRLDGTTLTAANTGAPLDAAGVEGLSTLRASPKREEGTVGRFGVGFATVLAVSDEPLVRSRTGAVRWSRSAAYGLTEAIPELADELARRGEAVPVLRLPFAATGGPSPEPYDTEVILPLRDTAAVELTRSLLAAVDDALLLTLPALSEVAVEMDGAWRALTVVERRPGLTVVEEAGRHTRWRQEVRSGSAPAAVLADRPVEERWRPAWSVSVAVPVDETGAPAPLPPTVPRVVHAPTPTDEGTALPALVVASFPLDPTRRHVAPGPLADLVVAEVAGAYADLVSDLAAAGAGPAVLDLVPGALGASRTDAALHAAITRLLGRTAFVPVAGSGAVHEPPDVAALRPEEAVLVEGLRGAADPAALGRVVAGLPDPAWWRREPLVRLGARIERLADVVDELAVLRLDPEAWRELYAALEGADREALAALPVPLADGRVVRGPRGLLLPAGDPLPAGLTELRLRVVHPDAAHPLLLALGAVEATADTLLAAPQLQAAVQAWERDEAVSDDRAGDRDRLGSLADAVLELLAASGRDATEFDWLGATPVPDSTGSWARADQLWLPGDPYLAVLDVDPFELTVDLPTVRRWGPEALHALGVRSGPAVLHVTDVSVAAEVGLPELDDIDGWVDAVLDLVPSQDVPPLIPELVAVADLDLVRDDAWPQALALLAADRPARRALVDPARLLSATGMSYDVPSYTSWWLRAHASIRGVPLRDACAADAAPAVRALLDPPGVDLDRVVVGALGLPRTVDDLLADPDRLLARLADEDREVTAAELAEVCAALARLDPEDVRPPDRIRIPDGIRSRVVPAAQVVVADGPKWAQVGLRDVLPGSAELADVLDLPLASDEIVVGPLPPGAVTPVPPAVRAALPESPSSYTEHDDLLVAGHPVEWWVDDAANVHASTLDGLARGLAWAAGRWDRRLLVAEVLRDPDRAPLLVGEEAW